MCEHVLLCLHRCTSVRVSMSVSECIDLCVCLDVHVFVCVCKTQGSAKSWGPSTHMEYDHAGSAHRTKPQLAWRIQEAPQLRDFQGPRRTRSSKVSPQPREISAF